MKIKDKLFSHQIQQTQVSKACWGIGNIVPVDLGVHLTDFLHINHTAKRDKKKTERRQSILLHRTTKQQVG
jgi:hypothetical protein